MEMEQPQPQSELLFWVAYQEDEKGKRYLSDGKKHLRVFKSEKAIRDHLSGLFTAEELESVTVHSIPAKIAVPEPPQKPKQEVLPITTLSRDNLPLAASIMLENYKRRHGIK